MITTLLPKLLTYGAIALVYLLVTNIVLRKFRPSKKTKKSRKGYMMMTLGRGGHTAEMLYMSQRYDFKKNFKKVYIIVADDDNLSIVRSYAFWKAYNVGLDDSNVEWVKIPRSRVKEEGALKSAIQALKSMAVCAWKLYRLPQMDGVVSCGAGIALSVFIPYFAFFVSFLIESLHFFNSSLSIFMYVLEVLESLKGCFRLLEKLLDPFVRLVSLMI